MHADAVTNTWVASVQALSEKCLEKKDFGAFYIRKAVK